MGDGVLFGFGNEEVLVEALEGAGENEIKFAMPDYGAELNIFWGEAGLFEEFAQCCFLKSFVVFTLPTDGEPKGAVVGAVW